MSKHAHFAAVDICNRFATHYMDVSANAGPWGTKHLEDVTRIVQEAITKERKEQYDELKNVLKKLTDMNTQTPPKPNPHATARRLDAIKALRQEHTRRFMAEDYASMQTVSEKIKKAWEDYDFSCRCSQEKRVCFNCCAKPDEQFAVEAPGRVPMLFCSAACRMEFGVSLGLT